MKFKKFLSFLFLAVIIVLFECSAADAPKTSGSNTVVFCGDEKFAPYTFFQGRTAAGYSVDLIKILSATINKDIKIKLVPWEKCLSGARSGEFSGLLGAPVYNKWKKFLDYSTPLTKIEFAIFVESSNKYVNSIKSLEGTLVGINEESLIVNVLQKFDRIKLVRTRSVMESLDKLKNREITAVIAEKDVALYYIQQNNITNIKIVGATVASYDYALAVAGGSSELLKEINRGIEILRENDTLKKLKRKWFGLRLLEPFPWQMVVLATSGITLIMFILAGILWAISMKATVKAKTQQIQLMSQKMIEKDKLAVLGKLAGQIAHELRTPLSIINNSVYLLKKQGPNDVALFKKRLRVLEDKVKLSSNILESILSYSRVKAEVATTVSIKAVIEEVIKDIEFPEGIKKEISFENEGDLMIFMDSHQIYSVLRNMFLNAVQAMGETGKLSVRAFPSDDKNTVHIHIQDTGPGIIDSIRNKIFTLFYTTKITGTGLGLPISKSILEASNGELTLKESSEKGSFFVVKIPSIKATQNGRTKKTKNITG